MDRVDRPWDDGDVDNEEGDASATTFTITPLRPGELWITIDMFENLPREIMIPELVVDVSEEEEPTSI